MEVLSGKMDSEDIVRFERIIRNTIVDNERSGSVEGKRGIIYIATGLDADGDITGIWGYRGVVRIWNFEEDAELNNVQQFLTDHASETIEDLVEKDLMDA